MGDLPQNKEGEVLPAGDPVCAGGNHEPDNHAVTFSVRTVVSMETAIGVAMERSRKEIALERAVCHICQPS